ncbi:hypothetical protein [Mycobacterium shigaense]|uniref:Uncharacterized protein n=1 Tax=Mycobacterium shigaense TaxID=722731 RepID=A0A1Z4EFJ6_9MYCO|nr:hypothetical protein [Mycobacterium shigaense]MEA1124733.1 hypothetical protein [Mycobacterium shigaense]PRI16446.1 hypothetical protein B2J96_06650 [Mycobacterium shigaense]BAX91719.1 hypothetical protein MSG_01563 [Mycobacterium shigaense]
MFWRKKTRHGGPSTFYELTDRLHGGRTLCVGGDAIASTVSMWLHDLDISSPLVEDFARAVRAGDWPTAHAIGECLSVDVRELADVETPMAPTG